MNEQEKEPVNSNEQVEPEAATEGAQEPEKQAEVAAEADTVTEPDSDQDLSAQLVAAKEEIAKLKDGYLRAKAEEDNIRRRSEKEVANSRKFAIEGFAKELLQVRDSLKLACNVEIEEDADAAVNSINEGVQITLKQLDTAFSKFSLTEIAPEVGDKLDPNLHQAMSIVESDEADSGCIINVIQSGFELHDRLLRPAMVIVAK